MDKTVYVVCCALAFGLMVIGEAVAKAEAGCFLPNRICGVKIPDEKAGGGEFEVVECNGLRWYVDAKATSVTGSVFRTMTCTYDYRSGRTLSVLLRRVFDDDTVGEDCKADFHAVSRELDSLNEGVAIFRDKTLTASNSISRSISRSDLVHINLSLTNIKGAACPKLELGWVVPAGAITP